MTEAEIRETFRYHPPDEERVKLHEEIQEIVIEATVEIAARLPLSRERSLFITGMQDAKMWANAAAAIHGPVK